MIVGLSGESETFCWGGDWVYWVFLRGICIFVSIGIVDLGLNWDRLF